MSQRFITAELAVSVWTWLSTAEMPGTPSGHFWHTETRIRNRCCTWWGPSRDNNSASVHEYFRWLAALLISEDTAKLAKEPIGLTLDFGPVVINLLKKGAKMQH